MRLGVDDADDDVEKDSNEAIGTFLIICVTNWGTTTHLNLLSTVSFAYRDMDDR